MLDIPVRVKDALRDGRLLKNYKFRVEDVYEAGQYDYEPYATISTSYYTFRRIGEYLLGSTTAGPWDMFEYEAMDKFGVTSGGWGPTIITIDEDSIGLKVKVLSNTQPLYEIVPKRLVIDNDSLVAESVKFDERMCSGDTLKFGLCEGTSLEFQYFDKPDIMGKRLEALLDVQYIPDTKSWGEVYEFTNYNTEYIFGAAGDYKLVIPEYQGFNITYIHNGVTTTDQYFPVGSVEEVALNDRQVGDKIITSGTLYTFSLQKYDFFPVWYNDIPMGFFTVAKCPQQYSTGIFKVTAYNKLMSNYLDAKANLAIEDIASTGIAGVGQTVNVGLILDKLLSDYSVQRAEHTLEGTWSYSLPESDTSIYQNVTSSGTLLTDYLHVMYATITFTPTSWDTLNVYRALALCSDLYLDTFAYLPSENLMDYYMSGGLKWATLYNIFNFGLAKDGTDVLYGIGSEVHLKVGSGVYYQDMTINVNESRGLGKVVTNWGTNSISNGFEVKIPVYFKVFPVETYYWDQDDIDTATARVTDLLSKNYFYYEEAAQSDLERKRITLADAEGLADVTLRDLQSAVFESQCQYGQLSRTTDLFEGIELNHSALYPADDLYPADNLYPNGTSERTVKSGYSKLWSEAGNVQSWKNLIITWAGLDENNIKTTYESSYVVNADGTQDYVMDDNWMLNNLTWTQADIDSYAATMVSKMQPISWFPFELWGAGLPYLEVGDQIEIVDPDNNTYTSYVLERQLNGIQNLQDTYINGVLDIF